MSAKNIVIVGGGSAGIELVVALWPKLASTPHTLTLITDKDHYVHYIAALRTVSAPVDDKEWTESTFLSLEHLFKKGGNRKGKVVSGKATSIQYDEGEGGKKTGSGKVITDKGDSVPFDILAIATGAKWDAPLDFKPTKQEVLHQVKEWREKIRDAKSVVVAGGGAVGIELCGEIRDQYPSKPITLVHNKPLLLHSVYPEKYRRDLATRLAKRGVRIILDDSIDFEEQQQRAAGTEVVTRKNVQLEADLLISARGPTPNPTLLETLDPKPITSSNHADVEATFQLRGHETIFALGDIIQWEKEIPQKTKHGRHAAHVCKNIMDMLNGKTPTAKYSAMMEGIIITIGKKHGAGYIDILWGVLLGDWLVTKLKGNELFVAPVKTLLGY